MKETRLAAKVTDLYPEQVWISDTLSPSPQTFRLEKTNNSLRNLTVTALTLQSPVLLLGWAASAVGMTAGKYTFPSFENMTKAWKTPSITRNNTVQAGKKFYFSKLCLWDTDIFKMIFTSYKKPAGKVTGTQTYLVVFFLVKTGGRNGKCATQRKQIWNYLLWLVLCVLLGNMGRGDSKHYLYAGHNLLIFPDSGFSSAVLLHVTRASQENDY